MTDQRISWFHGPDRPVNGNTVFVKPAEPEPQWWGTNPSPELDRLIAIFREALFANHPETGTPTFRWSEKYYLDTDNDAYIGCAPDQLAFAVLDHADEITALVAAIREQAPK